jgi:uncharacterized repeat protein (TIGR02543 family)
VILFNNFFIFLISKNFLKIGLILGIVIGFFLCPVKSVFAEATLVSSYDFNNNFNDSLSNSTLSTLPTNTTSGFNTTVGASDPSYWYWTSTPVSNGGGGFSISVPESSISSSDYSIGLRFAFNDLDSSYNKIIDYKNRDTDNGFYFYNNKIMFYPGSGSGTKTINEGDVLDMVVTRDGSTKLFTVYFVVDGVLTKEFEYTDTNNYAVGYTTTDNKVKFGFFHDDLVQSSENTTDGKVYSIKLWNGAVGSSQVAQAMNPKYLVTFDDNIDGAGVTMPVVQEIENGGKVTQPTNPTRTNYIFGGWYTTSDLVTQWNFNNDTISQNTTLYAKWTTATFTVSFIAGSNGAITGTTTQTVSYGGDATAVTAIANSGYHFTNWSDGNTQNPRTISGVDRNISVTANFAADDADAPIISSVDNTSSNTSSTITWVTNEESSSRVQYGLHTLYGFMTDETNIDTRVTNHSVVLSNLKPCARYFYRVLSKDSTNNQSVSAQKIFHTSGCTASSITTGTETTLPVTGGTVQLVNNLSIAHLNVPNNYAEETATFQINKLDTTQAPSPPEGKSIAANNFYDLIAVTASNEQLNSFISPITFTISYGSDTETDYIESTLDVYKYDGTNWIKKNCTLDMTANTLTCNLSGFSTYGVLGQAKTNTSTTSSSSPSSSANCTNSKPLFVSDLFEIRADSNSAKLFFTPQADTSDYYVSFSEKINAEEHGGFVSLTREGVQSETIYFLKPNTVYYVKIRGQNGCMSGDWSNTMKFKTNYAKQTNQKTFYKYVNFKNNIISPFQKF